MLSGNTNRAGPPARYHITRRTKSPWTYAPPSPPPAKSTMRSSWWRRGESIRGVVTFWNGNARLRGRSRLKQTW